LAVCNVLIVLCSNHRTLSISKPNLHYPDE
jgi:hypothetical protein